MNQMRSQNLGIYILASNAEMEALVKDPRFAKLREKVVDEFEDLLAAIALEREEATIES